jgi:tetratricopeptide (TPR) repeat protein
MKEIGTEERKSRLEQLLELTQTYRGWTRRELAQMLGRDPTKLVPSSGSPKIDLVVFIAEMLDWTVDEVARWLCDGNQEESKTNPIVSFETLDERAKQSHRDGEYKEMIKTANSALRVAQNGHDRARAFNRIAGGYDGLGRFSKVLCAAQSGLREHPISTSLRLLLQTTAASAHYTLWELDEAQGMAQRVVDVYKESPPNSNRDFVAQAHAWFVLGQSERRMLDIDPENAVSHAENSRRSLLKAAELYESVAKEIHKSFGGIANTCRGALIEVDVILGRHDAREALARVVDGLTPVVDVTKVKKGDWLESYGWWCIFGCNIVLRHISDEKDLQRYMALFTNKADEIADRLDHWAMRERVFSMQFEGRNRLIGWTGQDIPVVIDRDDIRLITGTMGRFPQFKETGWSLLNTGNIVEES